MMKRILIISALLLPLVASAASNSCESALLRLGQIDMVTGSAVYESGEPGEFYLLSQKFLANGCTTDFVGMVSSSNPIVRVMGAYCIIRTHTNNLPENVLAPLGLDKTMVEFLPVGCKLGFKTVADIIAEIRKKPDVLECGKNKEKK